MTDIDALIADLQAVVSVLHDERLVVSANTVAQAVTALTTERAKVAALEAEVERLGEDSCEWADLFIAAKAEATRWREVAGDLAGALGEAFQHGEIMTSERRMNRCGAALARFKQESGE